MMSIAEFAKNRCANIEDDRLRLFIRQAIYEAYDLGHDKALELVETEVESTFKGTLWEANVMSRFKRVINKLKSGEG